VHGDHRKKDARQGRQSGIKRALNAHESVGVELY
jgi:hypothetical protein